MPSTRDSRLRAARASPGRRLRRLGVAAALGVAVWWQTPALAVAPAELDDVAAKTEYAFLTEDPRALDRTLAGILGFKDSTDPRELYAFAHAEFRRLQLALRRRANREAEFAGDRCLAALERRGTLVRRDAEGLALELGCAGYLARLGGLKRLTAGHRRDVALEAARPIAASSPRLLLSVALADWYAPAAAPAARRAAAAAFRQAAAAFDEVTETPAGEPSWGAAEAWLFAGSALEEQGELVGARSAYERALLIAPDFSSARRRLGRLASRR